LATMGEEPALFDFPPEQISRRILAKRGYSDGPHRFGPLMRRYLIVSLLIGTAVSIVMLTLIHLGVFAGLGAALGRLYAAMGFFPAAETAGADAPAGMAFGGGRGGHRVELAVIIAVAFGSAWCVIDISRAGHKMLICLGLTVVLLALSPTLALFDLLYEPFSSVGAVFLATAAGFFYAGTEHGMRKRLVLNVLGSRVSPATFRRLMNASEPVNFEGATREMSVLTCRVLNHAELRDKMEPGDLVAMGNLFLRDTAGFLLDRGGYLDESSPDMVRVFFGMLAPEDDHALQACRAALELRTKLREVRGECESRWFQKLEYGVAIDSGAMTVGIYGSPRHFHFSGVGGMTSRCRRFARANHRYGSDLLIGSRTFQLVRDAVEVRPLEMLYDPEHNLMTEVYQLLALSGEFSEEEQTRRDTFWEGVILYRSGKYEEALARFDEARGTGKTDGPVQFFVERSQARLAGSDEEEHPEITHELTDQGHARLLSKI